MVCFEGHHPVVEYLLTRPDVEAGKIALLAVSQAGYCVPRSAAFEHRIAGAVADPDRRCLHDHVRADSAFPW